MKNNSDSVTEREFILCTVLDEIYAVEPESLVEILEYTEASPLPFVPYYVDGLININGTIIPQIDLASLIYGKESSASFKSIFRTVLVVDVGGVILGIRVGQVQESLIITEEDIRKPRGRKKKAVGDPELTDYYHGFVKYKDAEVVVLNVESLKSVVKANEYTSGKPGFLGKVADTDHDEEELKEYLVIETGGIEYAFALSDIHEINILESISSQPRAPEMITGVTLIREEPRLVLNLSKMVGEHPEEVTQGAAIMIKTKEVFCGFIVGKLKGLELITENQLKIDKDKNSQTILRQDGKTLTRVLTIDELLDHKTVDLIKPYMPDIKNAGERVEIKQVEVLRFEVGGNSFGLNVSKIHRVVSDKKIEPLISKHAAILGTMELEGRVVPVIDLFKQLGYDNPGEKYREYIVVNDGENDWGLAINETDQIVKIDENAIDEVNISDMKYVSAFSSYEGDLLTILNVNAICMDNRYEVSV